MSQTVLVKSVLTFVFCVFATVLIRHGPPESAAVGERIAIALIWVAGVAYMLLTRAKHRN